MDVKKMIVDEFKHRVFDESYQRIFKCLSLLEEPLLWESPASKIPAIGNLILHLCGNARQWILSGIGEKEDNRERNKEFLPHKNIKKSDLIFLMENLRVNIEEVLNDFPPNKLEQKIVIQGLHETGFSVIIHVIEHFSYHTGQITTLTKMATTAQLDYYQGLNLDELTKLN